jgi:ribose transport system permease protein
MTTSETTAPSPASPDSRSSATKPSFFATQQGILVLFIAALVGFFSFISKGHRFWSSAELTNVMNDSAPIMLMAIGMTFVVISGGIDLSVGSNAAMSGVVAALTMRNLTAHDVGPYWTMAVGVVAAIAVGALVGLVNSLLINYARLVPFVATLATLGISRGLATVFTRGGPVGDGPRKESFKFSNPSYWAFSKPMIIVAFLVFLAWAYLHKSRFGRHTFALGSNPFAANAAGISGRRHIVKVYMLSGIMAGLAGCFYYLRLGSGSPNSGVGRELDTVAAVVVGGVVLTGGVGTITGVGLGAIAIAVVTGGLAFTDLDPNFRDVFVGVLTAVAAAVQVLFKPKGR